MHNITNAQISELESLLYTAEDLLGLGKAINEGQTSWQEILADPEAPFWHSVPLDLSQAERFSMAIGFIKGLIARAAFERRILISILDAVKGQRKNANRPGTATR